MMSNFLDYIHAIQGRQLQKDIEPHVEKLTDKQKRLLREDQDLGAGAVRVGVLQAGQGTVKLAEGDVAVFHYTVRSDAGSKVLASTESCHGGSGAPCVVALMKGLRMPRGWELCLAEMTEGQRNVVAMSAAYGFAHADCGMPAPRGVAAGEALHTEIALLKILPSDKAKPLTSEPSIIKVTCGGGRGWETPRPPFEVDFDVATAPVAHIADAGGRYGGAWARGAATLGATPLPRGLQAALCSMTSGEEAAFAVPAAQLRAAQGPAAAAPRGVDAAAASVPDLDLHAAADRDCVLLRVKLNAFVEVRDMSGDGQVVKRKVKQGVGNFPIDAPINDATVTLHYSVHRCLNGRPDGSALLDTSAREPLTFTTGEGHMPQGVEMAVKLMLPGEEAEVVCGPKFGYGSAPGPCPEGVPVDGWLAFRLQLISFEKEGHPEVMSADEIISYAARRKDAANALYRAGKVDFALKKYEKTYRVLERFRDVETDEQAAALDALKCTVLGNLAAAHIEARQFPEAVRRCDAALAIDGANGKVLLRKGRALMLNGDFAACRATCAQVKGIAPGLEKEIEELLALNASREKAAAKRQKAEMQKFFQR